METDFNPNIPQSDPDWDYYELWQLANKVKVSIEEVIEYMANIENADVFTNVNFTKHFETLSILCDDCADVASSTYPSAEIDELLQE